MEYLKVAGRLAHLVDTWKVLTKDPWVLLVIKGIMYHSYVKSADTALDIYWP